MDCIFLSTEHLNLLDTEELNLDFNDLWFSDDNNMCIIFWVGEIPDCIKEINKIHDYTIYKPDEWMKEIEILFTGN